MSNQEMPSLQNYAQASNTYSGQQLNLNQQQGSIAGQNVQQALARGATLLPHKPPQEKHMARRVVQVFVADPNPNVPIEDCLLYSAPSKVTDATDQELFFEIDIKAILETHNKKRTTWIDKKVKERTEHLEPARIRDLVMTVVEVAKF